jgi:two-component system NtrC family response regulator
VCCSLGAPFFGPDAGDDPAVQVSAPTGRGTVGGGTVVLDEVSELSAVAQTRLLDALDEPFVVPLPMGPAVVRFIATTRVDLRERVASGRFREDLFLRLSVLELSILPLRRRRRDIVALVGYFLARLRPAGGAVPDVSPSAWRALKAYSYPGNVRELADALERALLLARGRTVDVEHLPATIREGSARRSPHVGSGTRSLAEARRTFEAEYLRSALREGDRGLVATRLGMTLHALEAKLREHGISCRGRDDEEVGVRESGSHGAARQAPHQATRRIPSSSS